MKNINYNNLFCSLTFVCVYLTLSLFKNDVWDGVILDYAAITNQYSAIKIWFFESSWFAQYYFFLIQELISEYLDISFRFTVNITSAFMIALLLNEVLLLSKNVLCLDKKSVIITGFIFITLPVWVIFTSSVMSFHLFCLLTGVASIRLLEKTRATLLRIILWMLIFIACTYKVLVLFLPMLYLTRKYFIYGYSKTKIKKYRLEFLTLVLICASHYFLCHVLMPPFGEYQNYNSVSFDFSVLLRGSLSYLSFFKTPLFLLLLLNIYFFIKIKEDFSSLLTKMYNNELLLLFILAISAVIPFILAGKYSSIRMTSFDIRHSLVLSIPLSLILGYLFNFFNHEKLKIFSYLFAFMILANNTKYQNRYLTYKYFEHEVHVSIIESLKAVYKSIPYGYVYFDYGKNKGLLINNYYTYNYLFFKATNRTNWFAYNNKSQKYGSERFSQRPDFYRLYYLFDYNPNKKMNNTIVKVKIGIKQRSIFLDKPFVKIEKLE